MVQSLPRVVRHKLVKGCRLKDSGRALHGVGERVKAVNNGPWVTLRGGLGSVTAGIALVAISLTTVRQARA